MEFIGQFCQQTAFVFTVAVHMTTLWLVLKTVLLLNASSALWVTRPLVHYGM